VVRVEACDFTPSQNRKRDTKEERTAIGDEDQRSDDLRQAELWTTTRSSVDVAISELTGSR
jgi:hypothetical protein